MKFQSLIDDAKMNESFHSAEACIDSMLLPLVMIHSMSSITLPL